MRKLTLRPAAQKAIAIGSLCSVAYLAVYVAKNIRKERLLEIEHDGVYHYSNEGVCSWYDFAKMIAEYAGHTKCDLQPCHSDEFPSPVKRPSYSVLDKTKIKETFGVEVPYWTYSLKVCMENMI